MSTQLLNGPITAGGRPLKTVTEVVRDLRVGLSSFDASRPRDVAPFHTEIAIAIRRLDETTTDNMDGDVLLMVAGVVRTLMNIEDVTWENVKESLDQNPLTTVEDGRDVRRTDYLARDGLTSEFGHNGNITDKTLKDVKSWLIGSIRDRRVVSDLGIDMAFTRALVSAANICIDSLSEQALRVADTHKLDLFSLGVLHFPHDRAHYFTLYRVTLKVWVDTTRELFDEIDTHGLILSYETHNFVPQLAVMKALNPVTSEKARIVALHAYQSMKCTDTRCQRIENKNENCANWPVIKTTTGQIPTLHDVLRNLSSKLDNHDLILNSDPAIRCDLCVVFGDSEEESLRRMADDTLIGVACLKWFLGKAKELTYDSVYANIETNQLFVKNCDDVVMSYNKLEKDGHDFHCYIDGRLRNDVQMEIKHWLGRLINDEDLVAAIEPHVNSLVRILETMCRHHDIIGNTKVAPEFFNREVMDLAILKFPQEADENIELVRLKISAFSDCQRLEAQTGDVDDFLENNLHDGFKKMGVNSDKENGDIINDNRGKNIENSQTVDNNVEKSDNNTQICNDSEHVNENEDGRKNEKGDITETKDISKTETESDDVSKPDVHEYTLEELKAMDVCGLRGEYQSCKYVPRLEVTKLLSDRVRMITVRQGYAAYGIIQK